MSQDETSSPVHAGDTNVNMHDDGDAHSMRSYGSGAFMQLKITWRKHEYTFEFPEDAHMELLFSDVQETLNIPVKNQKFLIAKSPMIKYPPKDPEEPLSTLVGKHITLMGSPSSEVEAIDKMSERIAKRNQMRREAVRQKRQPWKRAGGISSGEDAKYTFLQVKPLEWLPKPERSQMLLMKLKEDPGIKAVMKKRKFTVSLLTEMEPLQHTQSNHEGTSRTLGLNRNKGEVIELRLRTDAHDGYRDYKTIRKTLCHELTHNVHSDHDRSFWDLCKQIEREVEGADWKSGGHTTGESSRYTVSGQEDEHDHADEGGWQGGNFVLGAGTGSSAKQGWSRREILAHAALERQKKDDESECKAEKGWRPCKRPSSGEDSN